MARGKNGVAQKAALWRPGIEASGCLVGALVVMYGNPVDLVGIAWPTMSSSGECDLVAS
jgi:broad specificity polyphosphatase/5'/3'-nucleotidase SurE